MLLKNGQNRVEPRYLVTGWHAQRGARHDVEPVALALEGIRWQDDFAAVADVGQVEARHEQVAETTKQCFPVGL